MEKHNLPADKICEQLVDLIKKSKADLVHIQNSICTNYGKQSRLHLEKERAEKIINDHFEDELKKLERTRLEALEKLASTNEERDRKLVEEREKLLLLQNDMSETCNVMQNLVQSKETNNIEKDGEILATKMKELLDHKMQSNIDLLILDFKSLCSYKIGTSTTPDMANGDQGDSGNAEATGGASKSVTLNPPENSGASQLSSTKNTGSRRLDIPVKKVHIQGSPFPIRVPSHVDRESGATPRKCLSINPTIKVEPETDEFNIEVKTEPEEDMFEQPEVTEEIVPKQEMYGRAEERAPNSNSARSRESCNGASESNHFNRDRLDRQTVSNVPLKEIPFPESPYKPQHTSHFTLIPSLPSTPFYSSLGCQQAVQFKLLHQIGCELDENGKESDASLRFPIGVCSTADVIVVCDNGNNAVKLFDWDGKHLESISEKFFKRPSAAVVGKGGKIFIKDDNGIHKFRKDGTFLRSFGVSDLIKPYGLALTREGHLITLCHVKKRLMIFSQDGHFLEDHYFEPLANHHHAKCRFLAVHRDRIIVTDLGRNLIFITTTKGELINYLNAFGNRPGEFNEPAGVTIDKDGYIFIADSKNNRIQVFNIQGEFLSVLPLDTKSLSRPSDIHCTQDGRLLVSNLLGHRVNVYQMS